MLPESLRVFIFTLFFAISNFILISVTFPLFLAPLLPMVVLLYLFQSFYRKTSRELRRLESVARSPLVSFISETLTGITTIRAYASSDRFRRKAFALMDDNNTAYYPTLMIQRWMQLRLESLNSILVFFACFFAIYGKSTVPSAISGLAISYSLLITSTFIWCVKQATDSEMNMNSAERMLHYIDNLPVEGLISKNENPPETWPENGMIKVQNICLRYKPDLPLVIENVSFDIAPGEKVGIIGRTGAGKSTILTALLRLFELDSGSIQIDGIDIAKIKLSALRSSISIIPQEPTLFSGTIRFNLDPFSEYKDDQIWDAIHRSGLYLAVSSHSEGLEAAVSENGSNWSTGQRQLVNLI